MPLYIFNDITACNKSFYIGFTFLRHKDKHFYHWMLSQLHELYTHVGQEEGPKVILTDKEDALIAGLKKMLPISHPILYIWHINKNIVARATKYFPNLEQLKDWISLWYLVCQVPILQKYKQIKVELQIKDPFRLAKYRKSLYDYIDGEYLAHKNNQKHCYY